jgi:glycosyltransferase involved in cell wall biosynthesis
MLSQSFLHEREAVRGPREAEHEERRVVSRVRRIAWFSPLPPVRTGVALVSAELVTILRTRGYDIDTFDTDAAHDFPWRQLQRPYDLIVYQFGNSSHHDYEWAYALRYPGLVVLHDTHLHHARAAFLLREGRRDDYRAEFRYCHPDVPADVAELAVAGFDSRLYYEWPMVRALVRASRLTAVHGEGARRDVEMWKCGNVETAAVRLGHGEPVSPDRAERARREVRAKHGIPTDAILFICAGGVTPEKRVPQIVAALGAILPYAPAARLLLAGAPAAHYDPAADIAAQGLEGRVTIAGYVESDAELTDYLAASDVSLNLRWPTARETSGPWLRAMAAGVPTVITDLTHLGDVPSLDPRTWVANVEVRGGRREARADNDLRDARRESPDYSDAPNRTAQLAPPASTPVCVAIDILDEDHSLRRAMRRLATDAPLRAALGRAGHEYWAREHTLGAMADDYERVMALAAGRESSAGEGTDEAPPHLRQSGDSTLRALLAPFGLTAPW